MSCRGNGRFMFRGRELSRYMGPFVLRNFAGSSIAGPVNLMMAAQLLAVIRQPAEDALNTDTFSKQHIPLGDH